MVSFPGLGALELIGPKAQQGLPRGRRSLANPRRADGNSRAAAGSAVVWCKGSVAFHHSETFDRNSKFFRRHLAHGDAKTRAGIHPARIQGHSAIGVDREEAIYFVPDFERPAQIGGRAGRFARWSIWAIPRR